MKSQKDMKSQISKREAFLNGLRADPKKILNQNLFYDILISDDPGLFMDAFALVYQMANDSTLQPSKLPNYLIVFIDKTDIISRFNCVCYRESLIESITKVIIRKGESITDIEKGIFNKILTICLLDISNDIEHLEHFFRNASPLSLKIFFSHLDSIIEKNELYKERLREKFRQLALKGLLIRAANNNQITVLKKFKSLGIALDTTDAKIGRRLPIHAIASNATIDTAKFLLNEGADINVRDSNNSTLIAKIFDNIHRISYYIMGNSSGKDIWGPFLISDGKEEIAASDKVLRKFFQSSIDKAIFALENGAKISLVEYEIVLDMTGFRRGINRVHIDREGNYMVLNRWNNIKRGHIPLANIGLDAKTLPENANELALLFRERASCILEFTSSKGHTESPYYKLEEIDEFLSRSAQKIYKNKKKFQEISFCSIQYLRGLIREELFENEKKSSKTSKLKKEEKSRLFMDAAFQGHVNAAIKLGEYFLSVNKEDEACTWYQQAINNSADPKPSLLAIMGMNNLIKLAHGMGLRKGESKEDLQIQHDIIMRELASVDYSSVTSTLSFESLLLLSEAIIDYDKQSSQLLIALRLTIVAYIRATTENRALLPKFEDNIRHTMNILLATTLLPYEKEHFAMVRFMPGDPSECKIHHYYHLCGELENVNFKKGNNQRVKYWQTVSSALTQVPAFKLQDDPIVEDHSKYKQKSAFR